MQLAGSLVVVIQNYALKQHGGDLALGANGIITSVGMLLVMLIIGIAQGMQPIVGFNFGAKKYERVQETLRLVIITVDGELIKYSESILEIIPPGQNIQINNLEISPGSACKITRYRLSSHC